MSQPRTHNEWFQDSCYGVCDCGSTKRSRQKVAADPVVYIWGQYRSGKWRSIQRVCQCCFHHKVIPQLVQHANGCGCTFELQARSGHTIASWIKLPDNFNSQCTA